MLTEIVKIAANTHHMQHPFGHEELNRTNHRYANWQSKGVLAFTIATILSVGILTCFFMLTAYFKHRRVVEAQGNNPLEQQTTSIARNENIIHQPPRETSQTHLTQPLTNATQIGEGIDLPFLPTLLFPIAKGVLFISHKNSVHPLKAEGIPITESIPNKAALNAWATANSQLLRKLNSSNNSTQNDLRVHLTLPKQNAGYSECYCADFKVSRPNCVSADMQGIDRIPHANLKPYLHSKYPTLQTLTESVLEDILRKGNIDIHEAYIKPDEDDDLMAHFAKLIHDFLEVKNIPTSQLRQEIQADIENLSPPTGHLPAHLQTVYDQLLTKNPNYKPLFGLNDHYSKAEVIKAGKKIALQLHPDKNLSHPLIAKELFNIMSKVRAVLEQEATG